MFFSEQSIGKAYFFEIFWENVQVQVFNKKKKVEGKNKVTQDLFSSIIEKFNRYQIINHELACKEKVELTPIEIVYEPIYDENVPVPCYFTDSLTYRSYIGKNIKGKKKVGHPTVEQCPYCKKFFAKSEENMKNHVRVCAAKECISYCFNNGEIISFQDNFKYLGDVPFPVYFDFETSTGDTAFL